MRHARPNYRGFEQPPWAAPLDERPVQSLPRRMPGAPHLGTGYHWCIGALLFIAVFLGTNLALGDPLARCFEHEVEAPPSVYGSSFDDETLDELAGLVRGAFKRLDRST